MNSTSAAPAVYATERMATLVASTRIRRTDRKRTKDARERTLYMRAVRAAKYGK